MADNCCNLEEVVLGGACSSSCYPLYFSFRAVRLTDVLPLLNNISKYYDIKKIEIRKHGGGSNGP